MSESSTSERQFRDTSRGDRRAVTGTVVSTKAQKTLIVAIYRTERHAKYGKYVQRRSKVYAHDEKGEANPGDVVRVIECRPMSKLKRFRLAGILKRAGEA